MLWASVASWLTYFKRNANALAAILQNFTIAEDALRTSQTAAGSALEENAKYMDSITGKLQALQASWEQFSANVLNSTFVKKIIDSLKLIVDALNALDRITNGVSSSLLLWVTTTSILTAVLSAVIPKIQRLKMEMGILWKQSMGTSTGLTVFGQTAGFAGLKVAALTILISALAAAAIFMYKKWREANPTFEDLRHQLSQTEEEIKSLESEMQTLNQRISELQKLAATGKISLTEAEELERLKQENALLETQLKIKQALKERQEEGVRLKAVERAQEFLAPGQTTYLEGVELHDNSGSDSVAEAIKEYRAANDAIEAENNRALATNSDVNQKLIDTQTKIRDNALSVLESKSDSIIEIIQSLDPKKDKEIIRDLYDWLDQIEMAVGDPATAASVVQRNLDSDYYADATKKLKELANAGKLTKEEIDKLADGDVKNNINDLLAHLAELGVFTWDDDGQVQALINQLKDVEPAAIDASQALEGVTQQLSAMTDKYSVLSDAQDEFNQYGVLSSKTLASIVEKFPQLESNVGLYIAGMKSGKELLLDLSNAYQSDVDAFKKSLAEKVASSPEFYNALQENEKKRITDLAEQYKVDLQNFKDLETAKLKFQAQIIKKLAENSSHFHGTTLEEMKAYQVSLQSQLKYMDKSDPRYASLQAEYKQVMDSATAIAKFQKTLDNIILNGLDVDPSKYDPSKTKNTTDKYKKTVESKIKEIQYLRDTDKISAREYYDRLEAIEKKYYLDSEAHRKKYADEILELNKEIINVNREKIDNWIEDELRAIEKMQSARLGVPFHLEDTTDAVKKLKKEIDDLAVAWNKANNGNVDYRKRPILTGADILKAGWNSAQDIENLKDASGVTTYTQGYYGRDLNHVNKNNLEKYIEITPILDNGEILSPESLNAYVDKIFSSTDVLSADKIENGGKGLIVSIWDDPSDKELDDYFNKLQTVKDAHLDASLALQDLLNNDGITQAESAYYNVLKRIEEMIKEAYKNGNDENSDYVQQLEDKYKDVCDTIVSMVQSSYDSFKSYADDFDLWDTLDFSRLDYLKKNLKDIERLYKNVSMGCKDYFDA